MGYPELTQYVLGFTPPPEVSMDKVMATSLPPLNEVLREFMGKRFAIGYDEPWSLAEIADKAGDGFNPESIETLLQQAKELLKVHLIGQPNEPMEVLVVDDELMVREMINRGLCETYGSKISIVEKSNGREAIEYVQEHDNTKPDTIIMDIKMPEIDGITACRELRRKMYLKPILLQSSNEFSEEIRLAGPNRFSPKYKETYFLDEFFPSLLE